MTKRSFLDKLKRRLSILNEEEKQDILNEYKDIIAEKIKHGKTEEEAVAEFGNFEELVSGILSAYKIDPKAGKDENTTKEKAKDFLESGEVLIKDGAKKLTEVTDKLVNNFKESNTEITVELIFELVLKGLCALIIMAVLTLPFMLISNIGTHIFDFALFPLSHVLKVMWKILISVLYFGACIILIINIFKQYLKSPEPVQTRKKSSNKKDTSKKEDVKKDTIEEEMNKPERIVTRAPNGKSTHTVSNLLLILLKIFIIFTFLIPLWICIIGLFILLSVLIFILIKGISVIGIILGTTGIIIFLIQLSNLLYNGLFNAYKVHIYPFLLALIFIVVGTIMTIDFFVSIDYIDAAPNAHENKNIYEYTLTKPMQLSNNHDDTEYIIDNTLPDNKIVVEAYYYDEYISIEKNDVDQIDHQILQFYIISIVKPRKEYEQVMDNLRNNKFFDYDKLDEIKIRIIGNTNTKNLININ